eukprot:s865_g23.t1
MIQTQTLILECTPAAGQNEDIRSVLAILAEAMGWVILSVELDLVDIWPCKRHRWWAILMPSSWNTVGLDSWDLNSPFDHVGAILTNWGSWPLSDESDLQLTSHELAMFHDARFGHDVRQLTLEGIAATILHSYANALGPCPCGCRTRAFHALTLLHGGLRGFYVISNATGLPRFLHPREAGLLLGLPDTVQYPLDVKTSLALLGLVASPIQAIWIYGHLQSNFHHAAQLGPAPSPTDWLEAYLKELLAQIHFDFGTAEPVPRSLATQAFGALEHITLGPGKHFVYMLLQAERSSINWNEGCALRLQDQRLGNLMDLTTFLAQELQLVSSEGPSGRLKPIQKIVTAVRHLDHLQVHLVTPGSFLFEILADMGLPLIRKVIDAHGNILPRLSSLASSCCPDTASGSIFASGLTDLSPDQMTKLTALLQEHGVPASKAAERAHFVVNKLGAPAIMAAFVAKNCWAHLKLAANKPGVSIRLVTPDELARHAEQQAVRKYGAGIKDHKAKKKQDKGKPQIPQLDPAALFLHAGYFKDEDGTSVPQVTFQDVQAEAHGIAISTCVQSMQWLQHQDPISTSALALLLLEELPEEKLTKYGMTKTSFPATYKGTGEPVLIFGCLKNLGDKKINRHVVGANTHIDMVNTAVVRLHVYRDELQLPWSDLVQSPVRVISQHIPQLQLCSGEGCGPDCCKSHAAVGETLDSIIMEVWGRSFGKSEGGKAPAETATYFSVFIRIPESILKSLLQTQIQGIYFDPRKDRAPDDRFRVIWLPAHSLAEAQHSCKMCIKALGLVRLRHKFGLRVAADEEAAFKQLKPEATFIATRVQRTFQLFPLPHGLQRAGLIKILNDLKWLAKPLQPGRGQQDGISWTVGSTEPPPAEVFTSFGKEVLITETTKPATPCQAPAFPGFHQDPTTLLKTHGILGGQLPQKLLLASLHLAEITDQLRDELQSSLRKELDEYKFNHDAPMDDTSAADTEERFQKIETTMGEIKAQQTQFQEWFGQIGTASSAAEAAIQGIQYTLTTHQQELHGLHAEVKTATESFGATLQKTLASHQSEMSADFAARFDKLEAMVANEATQ